MEAGLKMQVHHTVIEEWRVIFEKGVPFSLLGGLDGILSIKMCKWYEKNVENLYPVAFALTDRDPTDLSAKKSSNISMS
jgi:hypothetical protein